MPVCLPAGLAACLLCAQSHIPVVALLALAACGISSGTGSSWGITSPLSHLVIDFSAPLRIVVSVVAAVLYARVARLSCADAACEGTPLNVAIN